MKSSSTSFSTKVIKLISMIPKGKVATYGQIAKWAGNPWGARGVGWLLHSSTKKHNLPWQRVIKSQGNLSFAKKNAAYTLQKKLLEKEKITFVRGRVNLKKHHWMPKSIEL